MANVDAFYETGEEFFDSETGEIRQAVICLRSGRQVTNAETGEPEVEWSKKKSFQIPKSLQNLNRHPCEMCLGKKKPQTNCIEKSMVCGSQNVSPVVFMLPTLLFFPAWASILCLICEACIHIWSHKRNKIKKNSPVVYRSPLHLITSEFCAHCRSDKWMQKISRIQDKRTLRRKLIHPDIIRGVVR